MHPGCTLEVQIFLNDTLSYDVTSSHAGDWTPTQRPPILFCGVLSCLTGDMGALMRWMQELLHENKALTCPASRPYFSPPQVEGQSRLILLSSFFFAIEGSMIESRTAIDDYPITNFGARIRIQHVSRPTRRAKEGSVEVPRSKRRAREIQVESRRLPTPSRNGESSFSTKKLRGCTAGI